MIQFDFDLARRQQKEAQSIALNVERSIQSEYEQAMQQLTLGWKGEAADAYLRKASRLYEKMIHTTDELKRIAGCMNTTIKNVEIREEAMAALAKRREY